MTTFASINPYTQQSLAQYETISSTTLENTLEHANLAQRHWKKMDIQQRAVYFSRLATLIKQKHEELAMIASTEMGKPLAEAKAEVLKCARGCEFYAANAHHYLQTKTSIAETGKTVHVRYEPLGVILGVFPWNFPYWQILRSSVPIVLAGNAMLVKPAPNTPQCSLAIQQLINECGLPNGLIQVIFANDTQVAELIEDKRVKAITLTGSEKAGSIVASTASKHIKKSVLELGGSDPFIVLDDAVIEKPLAAAVTARFQNNGQSCIAAKRFILHERIAEAFLERFKEKISQLTCGNPLEEGINIGPLARKDLKDKLAHQVNESVKAGAKLYYQQFEPNPDDCFYPPTILTEINLTCPAYHEELFGPVVSVYGLGGSVWSADEKRALAIANEIESGQVFINEMVKSQPTHPFGGVKKSGYGRELGEYGLTEFCNVKSIWM
jgi:succinate-semialdehyde dehydrogenase/glutarate-semialdehyde dehydrogenase